MNQQERGEADRVTQIGRALRELGIGWIAAYSPQAKGRVERSFETDQDRLVKLLYVAPHGSGSPPSQFPCSTGAQRRQASAQGP